MALLIGDQLKQARLARNLTIEQASQATHIRAYYLEALENEQRDQLPSVVQGRGFLRLYAGFLNLDAGRLLAAWDGKPVEEPSVAVNQPVAEVAQPVAKIENQTVTEPYPAAQAKDGPEWSPENIPVATPVLPEKTELNAPQTDSNLIFQEIGKILQKQRESLGLSLPEVERYTRLRQHYILALEQGKIDNLPSTVQCRGMLSNYAAFLNLDEEKILLRFAEGVQARRIERMPPPEPQSLFSNKKKPARQAPHWRRFLTPDLLFGIGVAAIILFFALWTAARISKIGSNNTEPTPPGVAQVLLTPSGKQTGTIDPDATPGATVGTGEAKSGTPHPESTENPEDLGAAAGQTAAPGATAVDGTASGAATGETTSNPSTPAEDSTGVSQGAVSGTATIMPINDDPLQVYIVASQRSWLQMICDGNEKFLGRTVPGNAYAFSGSKKIEMLTGNAGGLQVFYNQNDWGKLGTDGEVVHLVFSAEGVFTPTPAVTTTATQTVTATMTPLATPTSPATPTITPFIPK